MKSTCSLPVIPAESPLGRPEMPAGIDLVLIPRIKEEPPLEELQRGLIKLVKQLARKLNVRMEA